MRYKAQAHELTEAEEELQIARGYYLKNGFYGNQGSMGLRAVIQLGIDTINKSETSTRGYDHKKIDTDDARFLISLLEQAKLYIDYVDANPVEANPIN